jgi:hypothetical protein
MVAEGDSWIGSRRQQADTIMVASPQLMIDAGAGIGLPTCKSDRPLVINRSRPALDTLFQVCLIGGDEEHLSSVAEACLGDCQLSHFSANSIASAQKWAIELGAQLDLSNGTKGYTLDRAAERVDEFTVADAILHAGTQTVLAKGNSLTGQGWPVRIGNPASDAQGSELFVELHDEALTVVVTQERQQSAYSQQQFVVLKAAVLVIAPTAFEAEIFTTALLQMGRSRASDFLAQQIHRLSVAWLDAVTDPHQGTWQWLTPEREARVLR